MQMPALKKRSPLSTPGKVAFWSLIGCACTTGLLALFLGFPDGFGPLIATGVLLCGAGLTLLRTRWTPAIGTLMCIIIAFIMFRIIAFPWYHLTHPRPDYLPFMLNVLILTLLTMAGIASLVTIIQNYLGPIHTTSDWLKPILSGILGVVLGALLLAAIQAPSTTSTVFPNGEATVHMGPGSFLQATVTVTKGSNLLLVDDGTFTHNLTNGIWANGVVTSAREPGAPSITNQSIESGQIEIGPFSTAGTFHIACTIHQGMSLTIIVT